MNEETRKKYCNLLMFDMPPPNPNTAGQKISVMVDYTTSLETSCAQRHDNFIFTSFIEPMKVSPTYAAVHHRSNAKSRSKPLNASLHPNPQLSPSSSINGLADQISTRQLQSELQAEKAPRPPNAFILYRRAKQPEVIRQQGHTSNAKLSQLLGEMWKNETEEIKYHWKRAADRKKMEHSQKYPGYVYRPKKPAHDPKKRNLKRNNEKKSVPTNFEVMVMNSNHTESTPETSNTSCQSSYPNVNNEDFNNFLKKSWLTHTNNEGQGFCNSHDTQYLDQLHPFFDESVTGQLQNAQQINDPFTAAAPYPLIYDYQQQGDLLDVQSSSEFSLPNFDTIPFPTDSIIQANLL